MVWRVMCQKMKHCMMQESLLCLKIIAQTFIDEVAFVQQIENHLRVVAFVQQIVCLVKHLKNTKQLNTKQLKACLASKAKVFD